jgi:hypothetical protein
MALLMVDAVTRETSFEGDVRWKLKKGKTLRKAGESVLLSNSRRVGVGSSA